MRTALIAMGTPIKNIDCMKNDAEAEELLTDLVTERHRPPDAPTDRQLGYLTQLWDVLGTPAADRQYPTTRREASDLIEYIHHSSPEARQSRPPTDKQKALLHKLGLPIPSTLGAASKMLDAALHSRPKRRICY